MEFEILKKSHKKEILTGAVVFILITIVLIVRASFAKYQTTKNVIIAEGTVNYKVPDFKIMAMYKNDGNGDVEITTMPEEGYEINKERSYCTTDNVNKVYNKVFTNEEGKHVITGLSKDSKCYIYFDKKIVNGSQGILANIKVNEEIPNFAAVATTDEGVFKAKDESGKDSYYWRGAVTNNYVKFADKYWRIIRINGDGTIRMIYDGISIHNNGTSTDDSIAISNQRFNTSYNDNMYVGFKYTSGQAQGTGTKSNALTQLEIWYTNNLASYASKLDTNAGFCGDRRRNIKEGAAPNGTGGTGTTDTHYAAKYRLFSNKMPELSCETIDFYTMNISAKGNKSLSYPIGLITADEVSMAGGVYGNGTANSSYYLYNGKAYWTLSPGTYGYASVFAVNSTGALGCFSVGSGNDVRPVINLKADVTLTGKGTASDPYVVV